MPESQENKDPVSRWFLATVAVCGFIYAGCGWTPSSYGFVMNLLQAPAAGPVAGTPQAIRSDEWAVETPYFQAAVRNHFRRINETSFYREDLRNYYPLPLADWSLLFKPEMWAFFVLPPATAFSIYHAFWMGAFLAGYFLLFRELGVQPWVCAAVAVMVFFSGFTQFWWTTYGPLLAGFPWILILILRPMAWWKKLLLCAWVFPAFVFSHVYPTLLLTLAWSALITILAFRPGLLRSRGDLAAILTGVAATVLLLFAYYWDVIPIMRNTVYPGHRISPPGGTPFLVAFSQLFPTLCFRLNGYQNITGQNICEIGTVASFLPLLTLCMTRYRSLRTPSGARRTVLILLGGIAAITLWETVPVPAWIGHLLLWDTGDSGRWLFASGILLTLVSLSLWSNQLLSFHPFRFTVFAVIGPVAAVLLKGDSLGEDEILLYGLIFVAALLSWYLRVPARAPVVLIAMVAMNVYVFGRFNPLQPARPIFQTPDSPIVRALYQEAAASPNGVLVEPQVVGSILNGLGFRSVSHTLLAPRLPVFRQFFPTMAPERFNQVFNRYAYIKLMPIAMPAAPVNDVIELPMAVFLPVRNSRQVLLAPADSAVCSQKSGGAIERVSQQGDQLIIKGWAPWPGESSAQGIRISSGHPVHVSSFTTITRADIAEQLQDYRFVKSGFRLQISGADPKQLALTALGTAPGDLRLACCGCP
jgi:hypothetical protein